MTLTTRSHLILKKKKIQNNKTSQNQNSQRTVKGSIITVPKSETEKSMLKNIMLTSAMLTDKGGRI